MNALAISNIEETNTNIPKKSGRGRKPKNTVENTKQKITEMRAKTTQTQDPENQEKEVTLQLQTFHHNFSDQIAERFTYFATLHRYDDRKTFKEAWQKWILEEDVAADIQTEIQSLETNHYTGDILDKMFKSVRYYYRKKPIVPKLPSTRKTYVALPVSILESMDKHIIETMLQHTNPETTECSISPAKAFELYMQRHNPEQQQTQEHIQEQTQIDIPKYKKTYKNRFFIASKNIRQIGGTKGNQGFSASLTHLTLPL
jgi:hypothetical protein